MGIAIPQVVTEDRASGALVIDGSLKFDDDKVQYLRKAFTTEGNRRTFTWSCWLKLASFGDWRRIFTCEPASADIAGLAFRGDGNTNGIRVQQQHNSGTPNNHYTTVSDYDDTSWYHLIMAVDTTIASPSSDRIKVYVNGELQDAIYPTGAEPAQNTTWFYNSTANYHEIGNSTTYNTALFDGHMTQCYWIDGQQLGPEYFGYTDPLTNTWRPKKLNGFGNTAPNEVSTTWSDSLTSNVGFYSGEEAIYAFDGSTDTYASVATGGASNYINFACNIPIKSSLRVKVSTSTNYVHINGNVSADVSGTGYLTVPSPPATLTQLRVYGDTGIGARIYAIEVDGVQLINNGGWGINGFYLPMDGNSPIGEDKSGRGNNWTPVNFGGSMELPKATGAIPILNTNDAGTVARNGVRTDKKTYTVTASGGKYYLDGVETPTLNFLRGGTYIFDYTGATSHPFKFSTTSDGTHGGGSEYTDGTNTATSNVMKITVPHNAPDTLYYYCSVHSGMGSSINVTTDIFRADPYAWKNVLALPLVGSNTDESANINVNSSAKTLAVAGNTSPRGNSNHYGSSYYFDGTGDYLGATSNADFAMGTGDFTLECWVYRDSANAFTNFIATRGAPGTSAGYTFGAQSNANGNDIEFYTDGLQLNGGTQFITNGKWHHVAVTRSGTNLSCFVNGILSQTVTNSQNFSNTSLAIGITNDASQGPLTGYLQDIRVYKGVAKYSASAVGEQAFIVPSIDPDFLPDTPSGVAYGSALTKITDGAVAFDGSSGYLSMSHNADFDLTNQDFTLEGYFKHNHTSGYVSGCGVWREASGADYWSYDLRMTQGGSLPAFIWSTNGSSVGQLFATTPIGDNAWHHVAATRSGTTLRIFVDGRLEGTTTTSDTINTASQQPFVCGYRGSTYYNGFMSNVRLIKGTALYTSDFTPPTSALTNVTNTKLLCCQSNTSATAAAVAPGSITANGNAAATNFNPFTTDINTVRGQDTGYATWNPLESNLTLSDGNLSVTSSAANTGTRSNIAVSSGKWYWEYKVGTVASNSYVGVSQFLDGSGLSGTNYLVHGTGGNNYNTNTGGSFTVYNAAFTTGMIIGLAFDYDGGNLDIYKDGILAFRFSGGNFAQHGAWKAHISFNAAVTIPWETNFGQKPFKFPPPDGFKTLSINNLRPSKVIIDPRKYFEPLLFAGNGTSQSITGLSFGAKPDIVWIKDRSNTSNYSHRLVDSVRGSTRVLFPDQTNAEQVNLYGTVDQFTVNGFDLRQGSNSIGDGSNTAGSNLVAWCWKAGGGSSSGGEYWIDDVQYADAAAAGLDGGSGITLTGASVGTKQGFSILRYTGGASGSTLSHGLTQAPDFWIIKNLSGSTQGTAGPHWYTKHKGLSGGKTGNNSLFLNLTNGESNGPHGICRTSGDSLFEFIDGSSNDVNWHTHDSAATYICYAWHDVPGLQKFGTYVGNGLVDGPFIELDFTPALIIMKAIGSANWIMIDYKRVQNPTNYQVLATNLPNAENASGASTNDIQHNGFKIRGSTDRNSSGVPYIYAAWAKAPTFNLYGAAPNGFYAVDGLEP